MVVRAVPLDHDERVQLPGSTQELLKEMLDADTLTEDDLTGVVLAAASLGG